MNQTQQQAFNTAYSRISNVLREVASMRRLAMKGKDVSEEHLNTLYESISEIRDGLTFLYKPTQEELDSLRNALK